MYPPSSSAQRQWGPGLFSGSVSARMGVGNAQPPPTMPAAAAPHMLRFRGHCFLEVAKTAHCDDAPRPTVSCAHPLPAPLALGTFSTHVTVNIRRWYGPLRAPARRGALLATPSQFAHPTKPAFFFCGPSHLGMPPVCAHPCPPRPPRSLHPASLPQNCGPVLWQDSGEGLAGPTVPLVPVLCCV